jgi:cytochrome c peroxidase
MKRGETTRLARLPRAAVIVLVAALGLTVSSDSTATGGGAVRTAAGDGVALAAVAPAAAAATEPQAAAASGADAAAGKALFLGQKALQNGGPACNQCHGVANLSVSHGPTPGADLTHEYSKLGADALGGILEQPPFPPMDELYKKSPLTPDERRQVIAFLEQVDQGKPAEAAAPGPAAPTPEAIAAGAALFSGGMRMQNGGPACSSCHRAAGIPFPNGGTMGPDLTKEYSKLGGQGLGIALKSLNFPAMTAIFATRPLTDGEQAQLAAFFQSIDEQAPPRSPTSALLTAALVALAGLLLWTWLAVGRRRVRSVRRALLERAGQGKGNR